MLTISNNIIYYNNKECTNELLALVLKDMADGMDKQITIV